MNKIRKYGFVAALIVLAMTAVPPNGTERYSLTFPLLKGAFASETASDAIIQEARNEAEKLLAVRSAVWLKFLDEWNAYLEERESAPDPTALTAPVFSSFTHLDDLLDKEGVPGYLPTSFPVVNYSAVSLGNEIEVTVTPSNAVSATYVPNFLPMAEVSGGTVKLRITRPGASPEFGFFVEKNAANEMGSAGTLEWVDGQGKIAVNELESNIIRSQAGGPIAVSSPVNITGDTAVTGNLSATETGTFTTMRANTIEGRTGTTITVAGALDLGANTITTTGDGEFGTVTVTGLTAASGTVTGALTVGSLDAGTGAVTGETGNFTNLGATKLAGNIDANEYNITGAGTVSGTTAQFTNLTLNGRTGTSASPYDVYVGNATNAAYATNAGTATTANNSLRLGGKTLQEVIDSLPASGPSGFPTATAIQNRASGNTTLAVTNGKWYKIQMKSGAGGTISKEGSYGSGAGVQTTFHVRATATTTWNIYYHVPTQSQSGISYPQNVGKDLGLGGTAVEIKQGTTVIACLGGGGGASDAVPSPYSGGGDAGLPGSAGGVKAGSSGSGGYAQPGAGGAAASGTRTGNLNGGSGYSAGKQGIQQGINIGAGGGGSSYINAGYGNMAFEQIPAVYYGNPLISIWVYN